MYKTFYQYFANNIIEIFLLLKKNDIFKF